MRDVQHQPDGDGAADDDAAAHDGSPAKRGLAARARGRAVEVAARHHRLTDFARRAIDLAQGKAGGPDDVA